VERSVISSVAQMFQVLVRTLQKEHVAADDSAPWWDIPELIIKSV
jgi:hypothetical protein